MKFDTLASTTPPVIRRRALKVNVSHEGITDVDPFGPTDIFTTRSTGPTYLTWVHVDEDGDCVVSCACGHFTYNLEVALANEGASVVLYSNGAAPVEKNPLQRKFLCKHLYRVWMSKGQYGIKYHPPEAEEPEEEEEEENEA